MILEDTNKTKEKLIKEIEILKSRVADLEQLKVNNEKNRKWVNKKRRKV